MIARIARMILKSYLVGDVFWVLMVGNLMRVWVHLELVLMGKIVLDRRIIRGP